LCGDHFGSSTLGNHINACKKRWNDEQMKLTPELRKPLPPTPSEVSGHKHLPTVTVEVQAFNSRMKVRHTIVADNSRSHSEVQRRTIKVAEINEISRVIRLSTACSIYFSPEGRLNQCRAMSSQDYYDVHSQQGSPTDKAALRSGHASAQPGNCSANNTPSKEGGRAVMGRTDSGEGGNIPAGGNKGKPQNGGIGSSAVSNPRFTYSCFLCGRNFGSRSLGIHLPQCLNRWELTEALLPLEEQRERPQMPMELMDPAHPTRLRAFKDGAAEGVLPSSAKEVDAFNRAMSELARRNWQVSKQGLWYRHALMRLLAREWAT
jgi:hypothetical protein